MRSRWLAAWLVVSACTSSGRPAHDPACDSPGVVPWQSGSRLRAKIEWPVECPDTPGRVGEAFHDSELDWDCRFQLAADGSLRCMPELTAPTAFAIRYYTSTDCSGPELGGAFGASGCNGLGYVIEQLPQPTADGDTEGNALVELGAATIGPVQSRRLYTGQCVPQAGSDPQPDWLCPIGYVTGLVGASETTIDVGLGAIQSSVLQGDDGSMVTRGLVDTAHHVPFGLVVEADASCQNKQLAFVPGGPFVATANGFADAGCTQPVGCSMGAPAYVVSGGHDQGQTCDAVTPISVYEPGAISTTYYMGSPSSCFAGLASGTCAQPGAIVKTPAPVPLDLGMGRLRPRWIGVGSTPVVQAAFNASFYDTKLDLECSPAMTSDGVRRCLPAGGETLQPASYEEVEQITE